MHDEMKEKVHLDDLDVIGETHIEYTLIFSFETPKEV